MLRNKAGMEVDSLLTLYDSSSFLLKNEERTLYCKNTWILVTKVETWSSTDALHCYIQLCYYNPHIASIFFVRGIKEGEGCKEESQKSLLLTQVKYPQKSWKPFLQSSVRLAARRNPTCCLRWSVQFFICSFLVHIASECISCTII